MALILKSFSQPDQLKRFHPVTLILLLEPYRLFLEMKGFSFPRSDGGEIELVILAGILAEPDEQMPTCLVEALHLIDALGTNEHFDELLAMASENDIEPDDETTPADLAAQIWMKNPKAMERKEREDEVCQRKSFESFRAANLDAQISAADIPTDLGPLEADLGQYFEKKKHGSGCSIIRKDSPGEIRYLVQHGQACKRVASRMGAVSTTTFFRPERTDIVIIDLGQQELSINASTKPDVRKYRELFGIHLFGDAGKFVYAEKYTLEPLREQGEFALRCRDIDGLESIWLTHIELDWGGEFNRVEKFSSSDVFKEMATRNTRIPRGPVIQKAVFKVKLVGEKRIRTVALSAGNQAGYQRSEECLLIEQWLCARGFVLFGTKAYAAAA